MEINRQYEIEIFDVSTSGEGIGRIDGVVTFVPGLVPGDIATVEIVSMKKNLAHGRIAAINKPSEYRVDPVCPYFERCGGCTLQHLSYDAQLRLKEKQLRDKLERICGGNMPEIDSIVGMDNPWHYRNKAAYSVYAGKAMIQKDGSVKNAERPRVGFFDGKGRNIVECTECPIQSAPAVKAAEALREYIKQTGISVYDEKTKKGRLRQLIVRSGFATREVMVMIVINGKKLPQMQLLADLMYDAIDSLNNELESGYGVGLSGTENDKSAVPEEPWYELKSLIVNYNKNPNLAEISTSTDVIYGASVIYDSSAGMNFEISPFSFYQVNPVQMEHLYDTVLEFADFKGDETVFDLYCGVGTIGLYCARSARYVWGIESVKNAILDANRNAVINNMVNIQFIHGKAEEKIHELEKKDIKPNLVIMDPPRAGCKPELLEAVLRSAPEKIIYVSCDAATLARDLKILTGRTNAEVNLDSTGGLDSADEGVCYEIERIRQIDQFCHSTHCETVISLSRKIPDDHTEMRSGSCR